MSEGSLAEGEDLARGDTEDERLWQGRRLFTVAQDEDVGAAGRSAPLLSDDAIALIHGTSRGLPRAVNNLAIQSLIAAYADRKAIVDESAARTAAAEVTAD